MCKSRIVLHISLSLLVTWQLGLVEREINEILRGVLCESEARPTAAARRLAAKAADAEETTEDGTMAQRPIADDDVCPICQEELLTKHIPVTYCRYKLQEW